MLTQTHPQDATPAPRTPTLNDAGPAPANHDWCVGHAPPERWDVSFSDRLMVTLRRWLSGRTQPVMRSLPPAGRRAA